MSLRDHGRALRDAAARLAASPMASLLSVLVIAVALSLPVGLYVGLSYLQSFSRQLSSDPQISIFLALDASSRDAAGVEERLRSDPDVNEYRFIGREQALSELKRGAGMSDVLDNLKQNPLPDAFVATVRANRPEALERLRDEASGWPKVAHVQLDSEWARKLDAALRFGRTAVAVLGALLAAALVAVTFNTIRLQILTRREEIEVSKLIGATNPFVRRPFLWFGTLQGLAGGLAAWGVVALALRLLNRDLARLAALYSASFHLPGLSLPDVAVLLGVAALLGWLGAWLSVARHLWQIGHE
ncbi:MAG TPA: permease-like cell division protein FtsX [Burkholderiales bacterium]|nr:permease-like cell division protein FtsX [Burkholderiales bacterium]